MSKERRPRKAATAATTTKATATEKKGDAGKTDEVHTSSSTAAPTETGVKKARRQRTKKGKVHDEAARQDYDKAKEGEAAGTPPLVVYPQTLVPSSVLDMISTPQQGNVSNGVRCSTGVLCGRFHSCSACPVHLSCRVRRLFSSTRSSFGQRPCASCSWMTRGASFCPFACFLVRETKD